MLITVCLLAAVQSTKSHVAASSAYKILQQGRNWWIQDPSGAKFVSLGVCCLDSGTPFLDYDPQNPSYAAWKSYPDKDAWATDVAGRLKDWHFNTIGAWSTLPSKGTGLYSTPILNLGASAGAPWKDLWSSAVVDQINATAQANTKPYRDSAERIGYFSDNEMGWWEGALFDWIWKSPNSGQRAHFVPILKSRYKSWSAVEHDFIPIKASGFSDLVNSGRLYLRPGGSGMKAVQAYIGVLADRYYKVCQTAIHTADPNALYLGDRYISNFYPEVASASQPYVDLVSTNLNASWNDGSFARYYLPSLYAATGKPILISEYYQAASENRSGNKNNSSGFPVASTQEERAGRVEVATHFLLSMPYVVGAHWFQYYDEPKNGRGDGENYDMGLVDTSNKPYEPLTGVFRDIDPSKVHGEGSPAAMDASEGIPEAPSQPGSLESWNRTRGYIAPTVDSKRADLYASYSDEAVYLALYWDEDRFAEAFYQDGKVPAEDFPQIHVRLGKTLITLAVPPKGSISVSQGAQLVHENRGVRNEIILKIPASTIGKPTFKGGSSIDLDVGLATRARAYFGRWKGQFKLGFQGEVNRLAEPVTTLR